MKQTVAPIYAPYLWFDGRGPSLIRWLRESDLYLPGSEAGFAPPVGYIVGAEYQLPFEREQDEIVASIGWIIFHNLRVIQSCDIDAHTFWHLDTILEPTKHKGTGIWEVKNSQWKASFNDRIVNVTDHYIVEFYDDVVEVLCEELVFGKGIFIIEEVVLRNSKFSYAYLRKAIALEKEGKTKEAIQYYQIYVQQDIEQKDKTHAQRAMERLKAIEEK